MSECTNTIPPADVAELRREIETLRAALNAKIDICGDERISALKRENAELTRKLAEQQASVKIAIGHIADALEITDANGGVAKRLHKAEMTLTEILRNCTELTKLPEEAKRQAVPPQPQE